VLTRSVLLIILSISTLSAEITPVDITPPDTNISFQSIRILDQKEVSISKISGKPFAEASDLAYDTKEQILYMVSDRGLLYKFKLSISNKIDKLSPIDAYLVTKESGKRFKKSKRDTEGLALDDKGNLIISFERSPKIGSFDKRGRRVSKHRLPSRLRNRKNYRSRNKMLESVTYHPKYGILTASEFPLKSDKSRYQTIYALNGKRWHFLAEPHKRSAVTAIEVMDDGNLMILERAYTQPMEPRYTTIKKLYLNQCKSGLCKTEVLAKMDSSLGWKIDNFEGLTRVAPHRYLMISDDNGNFFQRTLLIYFEVLTNR